MVICHSFHIRLIVPPSLALSGFNCSLEWTLLIFLVHKYRQSSYSSDLPKSNSVCISEQCCNIFVWTRASLGESLHLPQTPLQTHVVSEPWSKERSQFLPCLSSLWTLQTTSVPGVTLNFSILVSDYSFSLLWVI